MASFFLFLIAALVGAASWHTQSSGLLVFAAFFGLWGLALAYD